MEGKTLFLLENVILPTYWFVLTRLISHFKYGVYGWYVDIDRYTTDDIRFNCLIFD